MEPINNNDKLDFIEEGKSKILKNKNVFYNKVQEFNRDLSVLAIHTYLKHSLWQRARRPPKVDKLTILDALSATGLRSIRYALECRASPFPLEIIANDILPKAIETIEANIAHNKVENVTVNLGDASFYMHQRRADNQRFMVVDLDPYGSASPFLDAAVQAIDNGGLLAITCTDMAVLSGNHPENCFSKYNAFPVKAKFCHESALRILLQAVQAQASKHGRYIVPLASFSIDFYVRIFVQVFTSPAEVKKAASKLSYIALCNQCESFELQPMARDKTTGTMPHFLSSKIMFERQCVLCGGNKTLSGPVWSAPIHDLAFVELMKQELDIAFKLTLDGEEERFTLGTERRIRGLLQLASEELPDVPLYYQLDRLVSLVNIQTPPMRQFCSALLNAGHRVSQSHAMKNAIKTDAPNSLIWAIIKKIGHERQENLKWKPTDRLHRLLTQDFASIDISFTSHPQAVPKSQALNFLRFQVNPEDHWGPLSRPNKRTGDKKTANQNKRKKNAKEKEETANI